MNGCDYCLSAHSDLGLNRAKITPEEIALNRRGVACDAKANAAVRFATKGMRERRPLSDRDIQAVRAAIEIIASAAEDTFTNLLKLVAQTDIDFPTAHAAEVA